MIRSLCASLVVLVSIMVGVGCGDALVGGECASGFHADGDRCVPGDGGMDGEGGLDGSNDGALDGGDGGPGADGGHTGCPLGYVECDGACVRPDIDEDHCGTCEMACDGTDVCAGGACADACEAPRTACPDGCVDLETDPENCGECGIACASGECSDSMCQLTAPGHLVIIGHDYRQSNAPMRRIIGNAMFLAQGNPVNVTVFEGTVAAASRTGINAAIDDVADAIGRTWSPSTGEAEFIPYLMASSDVLLIYPQSGSSNGDLEALGVQWSSSLFGFLSRGGIVILLDGPAGNDGTWKILDAAGVFHATSRTTVTNQMLSVDLPVDAVMVGVPLQYKGLQNTVWFETNEPTTVVSHADGPVVIHRVTVP